ncbi:hypothetical protein AC1031_003547 [Aphanomyces cochlioides]|nr:hypothetical protein AC1031_003547 [Aphanomyces cochlioides]
MVTTSLPTERVVYDVLPFDASTVSPNLDVVNSTYLIAPSRDKSYQLILEYVADHLQTKQDHRSFEVDAGKKKLNYWDEDEEHTDDPNNTKTSTLRAGYGVHHFKWNDHQLICLRQQIGQPVGTDRDAVRMENVILLYPQVNAENILHGFVDAVVAAAEATRKGYISIFQWNVDCEYWRDAQKARARPIESVILPRATKTKLIADLDDFVSDDTKAFYANHGIPYKRSYLFYGVPGTGKTSLIQAMGGQYERNLYFLQPTHPKMTDDSLRSAIEKVPRKSIIVLEDIDALFDKDRRKKVEQSLLTFSGLLNALDGVGSPDGHIVVLTTNFRDQLDDALIRNGRVDVHVAFEHSTEEQMEAMFVSFYPGEKDGKAFATALTAALGSRKMSMAALQHYFVTQRRKSAAEAISNVGEVVRDLDERQKEADEEAARAEEEDEEEDDNEENGDDEENDEDEVKDEDETKKSSKDDQS